MNITTLRTLQIHVWRSIKNRTNHPKFCAWDDLARKPGGLAYKQDIQHNGFVSMTLSDKYMSYSYSQTEIIFAAKKIRHIKLHELLNETSYMIGRPCLTHEIEITSKQQQVIDILWHNFSTHQGAEKNQPTHFIGDYQTPPTMLSLAKTMLNCSKVYVIEEKVKYFTEALFCDIKSGNFEKNPSVFIHTGPRC